MHSRQRTTTRASCLPNLVSVGQATPVSSGDPPFRGMWAVISAQVRAPRRRLRSCGEAKSQKISPNRVVRIDACPPCIEQPGDCVSISLCAVSHTAVVVALISGPGIGHSAGLSPESSRRLQQFGRCEMINWGFSGAPGRQDDMSKNDPKSTPGRLAAQRLGKWTRRTEPRHGR